MPTTEQVRNRINTLIDNKLEDYKKTVNTMIRNSIDIDSNGKPDWEDIHDNNTNMWDEYNG